MPGTYACARLARIVKPCCQAGWVLEKQFLVYFLSFQTDAVTALHLSVVARIWNIAGELLFWVLMNAVNYKREKRMRPHDAVNKILLVACVFATPASAVCKITTTICASIQAMR